MDEILADLNRAVGVKGSLIVHRDGFVVKSRLAADASSESLAALSVATIRAAEKCVRGIASGSTTFNRLILTGSHGKMILVNADPTYLVVLTHKEIRLDLTLLEIEHAAFRVKSLGRIRTA